MQRIPTQPGTTTPTARLIAALRLTRRFTAEVQDLYSRPIAAGAPVLALAARRPAQQADRAAA